MTAPAGAPSTTRRLLLAVVALALLAAACGDDGDDGTTAPTAAGVTTAVPDTAVASDTTAAPEGDGAEAEPAPTTTAVPDRTPAPGSRYVALGSSYAAGTGIAEAADDCRSERNYPRLVAAALELVLVDVSCGGATTPQLIDQPQGSLPPQADVVDADTALVTVTIGGNDIGYIATALGCGDPATECSVDPAALDTGITTVRASLVTLVELLRERAPDAVVVLVTYPRLVPEADCPALSFSPAEAALVGDIGARLQGVFVDVAAETGVLLADPYTADGEHGPCAPDADRWVVGREAAPGEAFPYHPNAAGHAAVADLVLAALA